VNDMLNFKIHQYLTAFRILEIFHYCFKTLGLTSLIFCYELMAL